MALRESNLPSGQLRELSAETASAAPWPPGLMQPIITGKKTSNRSARRAAKLLMRIEVFIVAALIATIGAIWFEDALTTRSFLVRPADVGYSFYSYAYGDQSDGGTSKASEKAPLDWACTLVRTQQNAYCGFGLLFDLHHQGRTLDFRKLRSLTVKFRYEGQAELLRMTLSDYDPRFRGQDGSVVEKINQTTIMVSQGEQTVTLQLPDFTVAEWWKERMRATGESARPSFGHINAAEFITGADARPGEHRIRIEELRFDHKVVSTEAWYGGIAAFWLALTGWFLVQRRRQAQRLPLELKRRLRMTLDTIPQMVWSQDAQGEIHLNRRWEQFTGVPIDTASSLAFWQLVHPDERTRAVDEWQRCLATGEPFDLEFRVAHASGVYRWVLARAVPAIGEDGSIAGWYGTCTDVHDRVLAQEALTRSVMSERRNAEELRWLSEHDVLTSLPNRRAFQAKLTAGTLKARATGGQLGLLLLDLDHFKHTNDSLGHLAGDELLQGMAQRLKSSVRDEDFVARIGGDEFAVILDPIGSEAEFVALGEKIFGQITRPLPVAARATSPAASVGGAIFPRDGDTANDLFKSADTALYALKRSGRGGIKLFQNSMLEEDKRAAAQLGHAREAIGDQSIFPLYQPKIDLSTGSIVGFEALLRWQHPTKGIRLPASLDEAFRDYELAARIGELMQRRVASDIRNWIDQGLAFGRVAINASPAEFLRNDYSERLIAILAEYKVPAEAIEIEVTEQSFIDRGREDVQRALGRLRDLGALIALDDFGTGYSSLSHLRDFPVDIVKIDKSFVQKIDRDKELASIVNAVVNLSKSLNISVVAEGVELAAQRDMLLAMGCEYAQGHLFSAAVEASDIKVLLPARRAA